MFSYAHKYTKMNVLIIKHCTVIGSLINEYIKPLNYFSVEEDKPLNLVFLTTTRA